MLLLGILLVPMVVAAPIELTVNNYMLKIDDNILGSIWTADERSFDLNLSGLGIRGISDHVFTNMSSVKNLSLANNQISSLPRRAFVFLEKLEHLSLADNKIEYFEQGVFEGLGNLTSLNISNNSVTYLREGDFYGLGVRTDIITVGNKFVYVNSRVFGKAGPRIPVLISCGPGTDSFSYYDRETPKIRVCIRQGILEKLEAFTNDSNLESHCKELSFDYPNVMLGELGISKFSVGWYRLQDYNMSSLYLGGNNIVNVSSEMLNDLPKELRYVDLSNNKIERLVKDRIVNEYILTLNFTANAISEIEESVLEKTKLSHLVLSDNRLKNTQFAATLPPTLVELRLDGNRIDELSLDSFSKLNRLTTLIIAQNNVTEVKTDSLRGLASLKVLNLTENNIEKIAKGSFQDLKSLETLYLNRNSLTCVTEGTFDGLGSVSVIDLSSNNLTTITDDYFRPLRYTLYALHLSFNNIESLKTGAFVNVPEYDLYLDNNKITEIENGTFHFNHLSGLYLESNLLSQPDGEVFAEIGEVNLIDLKNNGITKIEKGFAKYMGAVGVLELSKNPIKRLENGALFGLSRFGTTVKLIDVPIELIQGGAFDDV